jgi:hypothetical protein
VESFVRRVVWARKAQPATWVPARDAIGAQGRVMAAKAIPHPRKPREWPPVIVRLLADPDPVSQRSARLLVELLPMTCGVIREINYNRNDMGSVGRLVGVLEVE